MLCINALLLSALYAAFLHFTENYIEQRRGTTLIYDVNPLRRQHLVPKQTYTRYGTRFRINSSGMRGPDPSEESSPGALRVFTLGGSSVFDHHAPTSWAERVGGLLSEYTTCNVESFNAGVPGYSSRESMAFYHDFIRYQSPDVVMLYHGWNDVKYMLPFKDGIDTNRFFSVRSWRDKYKFLTAPQPVRNWEALKMMLQDTFEGSKVLQEKATRSSLDLLTGSAWAASPAPRGGAALVAKWADSPGMAFFKNNVLAFVQAVKSDGALPVLVAQITLAVPELSAEAAGKIAYQFIGLDNDNLVAVNDAMVDVLRQVSRQEGVPLIDLRKSFNGDLRFLKDHVHMSRLGSEVFAEGLAQALLPVLAERGCASTGVCEGPGMAVRWAFDEEGGKGSPSLDTAYHVQLVNGARIEDGRLVLQDDKSRAVVKSDSIFNLPEDFSISATIEADPHHPEQSAGLVIKPQSYRFAIRKGRLAFYGYGIKPQRWIVGPEVPVGEAVGVGVRVKEGVLSFVLGDDVVRARGIAGKLTETGSNLKIGFGLGVFKGAIDDVRIRVPLKQ